MKKWLPVLFCLFGLIGTVGAQSDSMQIREFVQLNANGQFDRAQQYFAPKLRTRVSPGMLEVIWKRYMKKYGVYKGVKKMVLIPRDSLHTWMTDCLFEKATIRLAITFNPDNQLVGYRINKILPIRKPMTNPYETDTTIAVAGGKIAGTLLLPQKQQQNIPVVLIIPGSGMVNRDGNGGQALQTNMYKMLAESLAARGIASFRYDKRGIGQSAAWVADENNLRFQDFVQDAVAVIRFLEQDSLFSKIIIVGHSQGSLVGMLAAQQVDVAGFISLEGAGEPVGEILYEQLSRMKNETQKQQIRSILDSLKAGKKVNDYMPYSLFRPAVQPLLISWMQIDPAKEIQKLPMPVLIIHGTTDLQVTSMQAQKLAGAASTANVSIIDGMNHVLKTAPEERAINLGTYKKPGLPLNKELVADVVSFINSL